MILVALGLGNETFLRALQSIKERRLRSILTIFGIAIGIAAVVSLVSTGIGATEFIKGQLGSLGENKIFISPATSAGFGPPSSSTRLTQDDVDDVSKVRGVDIASGLFFSTLPVKYGNQVASLSVMGGDPKENQKLFQDVQAFSLESGRFLKANDKDSVVLGPVPATKVFSKNVNLGSKLDISGKEFRVVGIFQESGQQTNDNIILVPIDAIWEITGEKDVFTFIIVGVNDISRLDEIANNIQDTLDQVHGKKVFGVTTASQLAANISTVFAGLSIFLSGIAGISLIVAAVGISNTMLTSVLERTKEIGIMKAIGASNYDVLKIFLMESALIGAIGGIVGAVLGFVIAQIINGASGTFGIPLRTSVPPYLMLGGIAIAVVIGVVSGLWPAIRAAKLNPIEALRYE